MGRLILREIHKKAMWLANHYWKRYLANLFDACEVETAPAEHPRKAITVALDSYVASQSFSARDPHKTCTSSKARTPFHFNLIPKVLSAK
ncbi:hypothetical protein BST61_g987 [Cercospora zeina]